MAHFSVISPLCVFALKVEGLTQKKASSNKCFIFYVHVPHRVDVVNGSTQAKNRKEKRCGGHIFSLQRAEKACMETILDISMKNVCNSLTHLILHKTFRQRVFMRGQRFGTSLEVLEL